MSSKERFAAIAPLAIIALLLFSSPAAAETARVSIPISAGPSDRPVEICIESRTISINPSFLGSDAPTINILNLRPGQYAFTGEQIRYDIVVRDVNGALDIGHALLRADGSGEVICNEGPLPKNCDGLRKVDPKEEDPPVKAPGVTTPLTDRAFHCIYTVEPVPEGTYSLSISATDSRGLESESLYSERWLFNPAIALQLRTSDNAPLSFENGLPGQFVHSKNNILITNDGKTGLWLFIASSDLFDPNGAGKCPTTNRLDVEGSASDPAAGLYYRAHSGTLFTSVFSKKVFPGDKPAEGWAHMTNPNQNLDCSFSSIVSSGMCTGARPILSDVFLDPGAPVAGGIPNGFAFNTLTPRSTLEVEFKLKYPVPCIGRFSSGRMFVFGKPI